MSDDRRLSKLLFEARDELENWADVVEASAGRTALDVRHLVGRIDDYRAERGWSPHGFGGEGESQPGDTP